MVSSWAGLSHQASAVANSQISMVSPISSPDFRTLQYLIPQTFIIKKNFRKNPVNYMKCLDLKQKIREIWIEVKCSKNCCCPQKCSELHLQYSEHFGYLQLRKSTSIMCLYFSYFLVSLWISVLSSFGLFQIFIFSVFTQYSVVSVKILSRAWLMVFCSIMTVLLCKSCKLLNTDWSKKVDIASLLLNLIASFAIKQTRIMQGHKRYTKVNTCKDHLLK